MNDDAAADWQDDEHDTDADADWQDENEDEMISSNDDPAAKEE